MGFSGKILARIKFITYTKCHISSVCFHHLSVAKRFRKIVTVYLSTSNIELGRNSDASRVLFSKNIAELLPIE